MHLNRNDLEELDLAGGELKTAQDAVEAAERKFKAICARIGAVPDLGGETPAAKGKHPGGRPRKRMGLEEDRPPQTEPVKATGGRPRTAPNRYAPEEKILCLACGTVIPGVRYEGGIGYPYRHDDPTNPGRRCSGTNLPGKRTADGG